MGTTETETKAGVTRFADCGDRGSSNHYFLRDQEQLRELHPQKHARRSC